MINMIYAIIAALVFFCLLGIVDLKQKTAEIAELKQIKLVDCKFNKGSHAHTWKNACVIHNFYVEII